ncbi:MAG: desulfoferrodoxin family protein [Methylomonas sp.]
MERRDFIRISASVAGAGLLESVAYQARAAKPDVPPAADIYYNKEALGRWAGKEATHLPNIEISKNADEISIKIVTPHEMKAYEHYIVKHVLLDKDYKFLHEHMFDPAKDQAAVSTFTLKNYSGLIFALSLCNKHDLWIVNAEV